MSCLFGRCCGEDEINPNLYINRRPPVGDLNGRSVEQQRQESPATNRSTPSPIHRVAAEVLSPSNAQSTPFDQQLRNMGLAWSLNPGEVRGGNSTSRAPAAVRPKAVRPAPPSIKEQQEVFGARGECSFKAAAAEGPAVAREIRPSDGQSSAQWYANHITKESESVMPAGMGHSPPAATLAEGGSFGVVEPAPAEEAAAPEASGRLFPSTDSAPSEADFFGQPWSFSSKQSSLQSQ